MTHCLILAAGEGNRLRPYTDDRPKALVSFIGQPLIEYQINTLNSVGIKEIAIATGYMPRGFEKYDLRTYHNRKYDRTNMVKSLFEARPFLVQADSDLIISYGDIVYQKKNNLEALLATRGDIALMVDDGWYDLWSVRNENPLIDAETLKYGDDGRLVEIGKKPISLDEIEGQYTGLIKISNRKIGDLLAFYDNLNQQAIYDGKTFDQMYMTSFLQLLIDANWQIVASRVNHGWLEIDTVDDLRLYEKMYADGRLDSLWRDS